ncbi:MAG: hypothetical protein HC842_03295, partial [Cytophagales bacterium]|nr:hypothetical protein [Cytophagales bacterium]
YRKRGLAFTTTTTLLSWKKTAIATAPKAFIQWGSMAYYELEQSGGCEACAERLVTMAHWMIDNHYTLWRTRNTAYAYEGLLSAYQAAQEQGWEKEQHYIGSVIDKGLSKLISWQVGGPLPNGYLRAHPTDDPLAVGGVMNARNDPDLRIDVAQHQLHALLLALQYYFED